MLLKDFIDFNPKESLSKDFHKKISMDQLKPFQRYINSDNYEMFSGGSKFRNGDTIMARITPCLENGKTAYVNCLRSNEVAFGSTEFIVARAKKGISLPLFIYYLLCSTPIRNTAILSITGSSGRERVQQFMLDNYEIPDYSLEFQQHIIDTIGSIDDLIEKNENIILKIEKVVIDKFNIFYKNKCSIEAKLGDVFKCLLGGTPNTSKSEFWDGNVNWINSGEVNNLRICKPSKMITELGMTKSATKLLPKGTTVLAITGATLGQISLLEIDSCANQSVVGILENNIYGKEFIYPLINYHIKDLISHQTGGAQPHINKDNIETLTIKLPIIADYTQYKNKICPLMDLQSNLVLQNEKLKEIKEILLKKYFG